MSMVQSVYAVLKEEGYQPRIGEEGVLPFRYYGQPANFRTRALGGVTLAELNCVLPRPEPDEVTVQRFLANRPLCRLTGRNGQAVLILETMFIEQEAGLQFRSMLQLLGQYAGDFVWNRDETSTATSATSADGAVVPPPEAVERAGESPSPVVRPESSDAASSATPDTVRSEALPAVPPSGMVGEQIAPLASGDVPAGWEQIWPLLGERYHGLARALAHKGVPAPDEVQMDMLQGNQVRGSAIMMWGAPPEAVVICEPGQMIPQGYQGGTWLKHQTVEQVAEETVAHMQAARRL